MRSYSASFAYRVQKVLFCRTSRCPYLQVSRQAEGKLGFRLRGENGVEIPVKRNREMCLFDSVRIHMVEKMSFFTPPERWCGNWKAPNLNLFTVGFALLEIPQVVNYNKGGSCLPNRALFWIGKHSVALLYIQPVRVSSDGQPTNI